MPGGLTDSEFDINPRQSFRTRNWLNTPRNLISFSLDDSLSAGSGLSLQSTELVSQSNLVWKNETGGPGAMDSISTLTGRYAAREVEREAFTSLTTEIKYARTYSLSGMKNTLAAGMRIFSGSLKRKEGGRVQPLLILT